MSLSLYEVVHYVLKPKVTERAVLKLISMSSIQKFRKLASDLTQSSKSYFYSLLLLKLEDSGAEEDFLDLLEQSLLLFDINKEYVNIYCESFDNILISQVSSCKDVNKVLALSEIGMEIEGKCIGLTFEYIFLYKSLVSMIISDKLNSSLITILQGLNYKLVSEGLKILEHCYMCIQDIDRIMFLFFSVTLDQLDKIILETEKANLGINKKDLHKAKDWILIMLEIQNQDMDQRSRILETEKKLKPLLSKFGIQHKDAKPKEPKILAQLKDNQADDGYKNSNIRLIDKKLLIFQDAPIFAITKKDFKVGIHLGEYMSRKIVVKAYLMNESEAVRKQIENEIKVYQILSDKRDKTNCFLQYYGSIFEYYSIKMVMDYCENNLMDYIDHLKEIGFRFQESQFSMIAYKLVNSFRIMSQLGIYHQDIKPHNMLVDSHWNIKIIDFNVSLLKPQDFTLFGTGVYPVQGTFGYLSPELEKLLEQKPEVKIFNPEKSDVYSLGLVFFQLLTYEKVQNQPLEKILQIITNTELVSHATKNYLIKMLEPNPIDRPKFSEILSLIPFDLRTLTEDRSLIPSI